ncbi:MAG: hypothetical protein ISR65_20095 [Bacteriovoracaceae bacterium]|nr:hypothetical protein [Bacteriovoracaceae bacterium]
MKLAEQINEGLTYQNELSIVRKVIRNDDSTLKDVYFALDSLHGLIDRFPKEKSKTKQYIKDAERRIKQLRK